MTKFPAKLLEILAFIQVFSFANFAQESSRDFVDKIYAEVSEDAKKVSDCESKIRTMQIEQFGRVLPKLSGHCWDGCATSIVMPRYPREAKLLGLSGSVTVEAVANENGDVIFAKALNGKPLLNQAATNAAYRSKYSPKKTCENEPIKCIWKITYQFILK